MNGTITREAKRLYQSAVWHYREHGLTTLVREAADHTVSFPLWLVRRPDRKGETFEFRGRQIPYVRHYYNRAWRNERSVELALARDFLATRQDGRILELGNVLSHYGPVTHDVLDKYERSPRVINEDVVDFAPEEPYDVIISVSTLEHVGWDERPREPEKVLRAYENLRRILRPGGSMFVTFGLGQNPNLDQFLAERRFDFPINAYLGRIDQANHWREVEPDEARGARYGLPYRQANAVFVGIIPGDDVEADPGT
jgi:hypothetical protein